MAAIDRPGLFKGVIRDHGVTITSKAKLPQFVVTLAAMELWDEVNEVWVAWAEFGQVITGYFVLMFLDENGQPARCLNYEQVMKATGWDGVSFAGLSAMNLKEHLVQFRTQPDTYDGNTRLKVVWIDAVDAEVGLRKLSADDLKRLDTQFFGTTAPKAKPVSAPAPAPAAAKPLSEKPAAKAPPKISVPKPEVPLVKDAPPATCTMEEGYAACMAVNKELGEKAVPEEVLDDFWRSRALEVLEDVDEVENITEEGWAQIRDRVNEDLGIPF